MKKQFTRDYIHTHRPEVVFPGDTESQRQMIEINYGLIIFIFAFIAQLSRLSQKAPVIVVPG